MDVVILLVFVSLVLVAAGLIFLIFRLKEGDLDHGERLALSPLSDDHVTDVAPETAPAEESPRDRHSSENSKGGLSNVGN